MKCSWVLPNLAFGSHPRVDEDFQQLKSEKITAILSLQTDEDRGKAGIEGERDAALDAGLRFPTFLSRTSTEANSGPAFPPGWRSSTDCSSRVIPYTFIAQSE